MEHSVLSKDDPGPEGIKWGLDTIQATNAIHLRFRPYNQIQTFHATMAHSQQEQVSTTSTAQQQSTASTVGQPSTANPASVPPSETEAAKTASYVKRLNKTHAGLPEDSMCSQAILRTRTRYEELLKEGRTETGNRHDPTGRSIRVLESPLEPDDWEDRYGEQ